MEMPENIRLFFIQILKLTLKLFKNNWFYKQYSKKKEKNEKNLIGGICCHKTVPESDLTYLDAKIDVKKCIGLL